MPKKYLVESDNDLSWTEWNSYLIYSNRQNTCLICSALIRLFEIWQLVDHFTHITRSRCLYVCILNAYTIRTNSTKTGAVCNICSVIIGSIQCTKRANFDSTKGFLLFTLHYFNVKHFFYAVTNSNSRNNG